MDLYYSKEIENAPLMLQEISCADLQQMAKPQKPQETFSVALLLQTILGELPKDVAAVVVEE